MAFLGLSNQPLRKWVSLLTLMGAIGAGVYLWKTHVRIQKTTAMTKNAVEAKRPLTDAELAQIRLMQEAAVAQAIASAHNPFESPFDKKGTLDKAGRRVIPTSEKVKIEGLIWGGSAQSSLVIANGQTLGLGSKIFGAEVVEISKNAVTFKDGGKTFTKQFKGGS